MIKLAVALAASLVAFAPAVAKDKKPADPDRKICRSDTPTGSYFRKSTCRTASEWAQIDTGNSAAAQASLDHSRTALGVAQ